MTKKHYGTSIYTALCLLFLYAPILVLIVFSFNESKSRALFTGFSFKWYRQLFENEDLMTALFNSLSIALLSAIFATILGTAAAVGIHNMGKRSRSLVMNMTYLPVLSPEIVVGISMMLLFVFIKNSIGMQLGFGTVLIAHITFCLPYPILNVLPKLRQMDKSIYEAAMDLGCPPVSAFFKAVVPQIMPGILAGFLMAFTYSLDDFVITYFTSGSGFDTLPVAIYSMVKKKVSPEINALSTIIFVFVLILLLVMNLSDSKKEKKK